MEYQLCPENFIQEKKINRFINSSLKRSWNKQLWSSACIKNPSSLIKNPFHLHSGDEVCTSFYLVRIMFLFVDSIKWMMSLTIQSFTFNCYCKCYYMDTSAGCILQTDARENCLHTSTVESEPALGWKLHSYGQCYTDSALLKPF